MRAFRRFRPLILILHCFCFFGLMFSLLPQRAFAQVLYGTIVGNVKDPSGAVIPGANVVATNKGTNVAYEGIANSAGQYTLTNLQTGTYTVKVSVPGFKEHVEDSVQVTANNITRVDAALQLGAQTETVTVTAAAAQLQTDKADVHKEITTAEVTNLPLGSYRNYESLLDLVPGSTPSFLQNSATGTASMSLVRQVNGAVSSNNNTRLDGVINMNPWLPHHAAYIAPQESVQTVNIATNSYDAEQGISGGSAITVQTKSGTNDFHGVGFEYLKNSAFSAANFFTPQGSSAPKYIQNMFGANIGGPIKKDKLFFFFNFEGMRDRESYSALQTVATAAMKTGDLSATGTKIYDPATGDSAGKGRAAFTNGIIPASRISSVAAKMLSLTPLPNVPGGGFTSNYYAAEPWLWSRDTYDAKVDWVRSSKNTIWAKYSIMNSAADGYYSLGDAGGPALSLAASGEGHGTNRVQLTTIGAYYAITPKLLVDGTAGYTRYVFEQRQPDFGVNFGLDTLHIPGTNGPDPRQSGIPMFSISGYTTLGLTDTWVPCNHWDYIFTYNGNVTWSKGKHEIRFGPDINRLAMNHWQPEAGNGPRGAFSFNGGATALSGGTSPNRFNGMADFLLGLPQNVSKSLQFYDPMSTREWQIGLYFRDRWQATSNLTLNLGLRWEYYPMVNRGFHGIERYDPDTNKVLVGGYGGVDWNAGTTVSKKLFAPRFGIAYRLGKQGVLRAGYGIAIDPYHLGRPMRSPYPAVIQLSLSGPNTYIAYGPILNGIPNMPVPDISKGTIDIAGTYSTSTLPKGLFHRGYIQSYNFTYERPLPLNLVWNVGYVGTHSINIASGQAWPINNSPVGTGQAGRPLYQKFGRSVSTSILQPFSDANYNSLQTSLERRFTSGLMLKAVYTWSHSIDDNSQYVGIPELFYLNRGSSDWDRRQNFRTAWIYQLPWGPGQRWAKSGLLGAIAGGWQVNGVFTAVTGTPFTVGTSSASLNAPGSSQFADLVLPEVNKLGNIGVGVPFFDPLAFRPVTAVRFGNSGRNILVGPGLVNVDLGLFRAFRIAEGKELQFRAEGYNFTNTPHFNNPSASASDMSFNADGSLKSSGNFMSVTGAASDQRTFRFGLRISF